MQTQNTKHQTPNYPPLFHQPMKLSKRIHKIKSELAPVREQDTKPVLRQWLEIGRIALTSQFTPSEYYLFDFHKKDNDVRNMSNYISNSVWVDQVWPKLTNNRWDQILQNKWLFHQYYSNMKLPVPHAYGFMSREGGLTKDGKSINNINDLLIYLNDIRPKTLVIKPLCGGKGKFVVALDSLVFNKHKITGIGVSGTEYDVNEIFENINKYSRRYSGFLLEEKVEQNEFFKRINPFTTNTLRIITFFKKNGESELITAMVRCGRKGSEVDNLSRGGFSRGIDLDTGYIRDYGFISDKTRKTVIKEHPDLGVPFEYSKIPVWEEIVRTVLEFSRNTVFARIVGWDVIVTEKGPVIIEGNPDLGLDIEQSHTNGLLTDQFRSDLKELGIDIDKNSLSKIKFSAIKSTMKRWF
jgi:hypothetical protein